MHRIRQQNDVRLRRRIDPHRCPRKSRVPERSHRQQIAAIRRERRINIPSKPAQHRRRRRLLRRRHLLDRHRRQDSVATIQQRLRKLRQIVRRREQSRMPRHSAHPPRRRIVHHRRAACARSRHTPSAQSLRATPPEAQIACASSSAGQKYAAPCRPPASRPTPSRPALPAQ